MNTFKKVSEKIIANNGYRKIVSKEFDIGNGKISHFLISSHVGEKGAVIIFPVNKKGEVLFLREFRFGIEDYVYNFPMGGVDTGKTLEDTIAQELLEETGYQAFDVIHMGSTMVANYDENIVHYFFVKCEKVSEPSLQDGEDITLYVSSLADFEAKISGGLIQCPLTLSAYTLAKIKGFI